MVDPNTAIEIIFDSTIPFRERCSKIFRFQAEYNPIFYRFIQPFGLTPKSSPSPEDIPLFPIRGFKEAKIIADTGNSDPELIFKSSGTTGLNRSTHYIHKKIVYEKAILSEFKKHFPFDEYTIFFFLPGYDRNPQSSLVWMANYLTQSDPSGDSQFVTTDELNTHGPFKNTDKKILLFGAVFGLIDLLESGTFQAIKEMEILETGGMKTHRREMTKQELRRILSKGFEISPANIHSEYGMCELLSQMYAIGGEWFETPHWVQVSIRDPKNPSRICEVGEEGKIGIIDLANIYSCPFILTGDKGVMNNDGQFKILGRWNPDDLRGCNFLIDDE